MMMENGSHSEQLKIQEKVKNEIKEVVENL